MPQDHLAIQEKINEIKQLLETEKNPFAIESLQQNLKLFQDRYEKAKKVDEEIAQLREEMKSLLCEEL